MKPPPPSHNINFFHPEEEEEEEEEEEGEEEDGFSFVSPSPCVSHPISNRSGHIMETVVSIKFIHS